MFPRTLSLSFFPHSDVNKFDQENSDDLLPFLDASNAAVEDMLGLSKRNFFSSLQSMSEWNALLDQNRAIVFGNIPHCIHAYLAFFWRFMQKFLISTSKLDQILTNLGKNTLNSSPFNLIQLPVAWINKNQSTNWYYSKLIDSPNSLSTLNHRRMNFFLHLVDDLVSNRTVKLTLLKNNLKEWNLQSSEYRCQKTFLFLISLNFWTIQRKLQTLNFKQEILQFNTITIQPTNCQELLILIHCLIYAKLLMDEKVTYSAMNLRLTVMDTLLFRNVLFNVQDFHNQLHRSGRLIIASLQIGEQKGLFQTELRLKKKLEQRFQMWQMWHPIDHDSKMLYHSYYFFQVVSLPYKGVHGLSPDVYNPHYCNLKDMNGMSWQEMQTFVNSFDLLKGKYLCDAEVRFVLARRLAYLLLWLLSIKDENGNVLKLNKHGVLLNFDIKFPLHESKN